MKISRYFLLLLAVVVGPLWLAAEPTPSFLQLFPKNSVAVVACSDVDGLADEWHTSNLSNLMREPEIAAIFSRLFAASPEQGIAQFSAKLRSATGLSLHQCLSVFQGEVSLALVSLPSGSEPLDLAAVIEYRSHGQEARQLLETIVQRIPTEKGRFEVNGVQVGYLKGLENAFYYALLADRCLMATTEARLRQMLVNLTTPTNTLGDHAAFQKFYQQLGKRHGLFAYADAKLLNLWWRQLPVDGYRLLQSIGLADWQSLGVIFSFRDRQFDSTFYLATGQELRGINHLFAMGQIRPEVARIIPEQSRLFTTFRCDLPGLWREVQNSWQQFDPRSFRAAMDDLDKLEKAFLNFKVEELLRAVGPECTVYHLPQQSLLPQFVGVVELTNQELVLKAFQFIAGLVDYQIDIKNYQGSQLHYFAPKRYTDDQAQRDRNDGSARDTSRHLRLDYQSRELVSFWLRNCSFMFREGYLVMANMPQALMDVGDAEAGKAPNFNLAAWQSRWADAGLFLYLDLQPFTGYAYNTFLSLYSLLGNELNNMLRFLGGRTMTLAAVDLPRARTIVKHLTPETFTIAEHQGEVIAVARSNFGLELLATAGLLLDSSRQFLGQSPELFLQEVENYLTVQAEAGQLAADGNFYAAFRLWQTFGTNAVREAFKAIAEQEVRELQKKYQEQSGQVNSRLAEHYAVQPALTSWQLEGDWKFADGVLSVDNRSVSEDFWAVAGATPLASYLIEFEMQSTDRPPQLLFHWHKPFEGVPQYTAVPASLTMAENNGQFQEQWVTLKYKVHKGRITYWWQGKHEVVNSERTGGLFGFSISAGSRAKIRNLQITVAERAEEEKAQPRLPALCISSLKQPDPVAVGEAITYQLTVRNEGNDRANEVVIVAQLPAQVEFISASGTTFQSDTPRLVTFGPVAIGPNETLRCQIVAKAVQEGSATALFAVTFAQLQGKIVVKERSHIVKE